MLTDEDLKAIGNLIKVEGAVIRKNMAAKSDIQELKEYIDGSNKMLATLFKIELAETNKRIDTLTDAVKQGFHEIGCELKNHRERIEVLEEAVLTKSCKN